MTSAEEQGKGAEPLLEVQDLCRRYGEHVILDHVSFRIMPGDVVAVIGPSGCGKSTLIRSLNLLERAESGRILFHGRDLLTLSSREAAATIPRIGMVFQQFNLFDNMTVLRNVALAPEISGGLTRSQAEEKAMMLLERVGLAGRAGAYPSHLSGGQKQRVAIVRSLAMDPEIILFDEPTSALDPEMVQEVLELMRDLAQGGLTMMVVTHEMRFARNVSTRAMFVCDGGIRVDEPPERFFEDPPDPRLREFLTTAGMRG